MGWHASLSRGGRQHQQKSPPSFASPPLIGSSRSLVHPHRREVCPLARRVTLPPVSVPLQDGLRFFPPPYPHHRWLALRLFYLQGRSDTGLPRSTRLTGSGEVLSIRR